MSLLLLKSKTFLLLIGTVDFFSNIYFSVDHYFYVNTCYQMTFILRPTKTHAYFISDQRLFTVVKYSLL